MRKLLRTGNSGTPAILRLVLGFVIFAHGSQKMLGWFGGQGFSATMHRFTTYMHIPAPFAFLAIAAEFFGGIGLVIGLLTRVAAFGILVNMLVAIFKVHLHFGLFANWAGTQKGEGIEFHLLVLAIATCLMINGGGACSIDRRLAGGR
ncbi:MAG TPA: DoxX family protein [Bryobacteraceae bacterium]|nr:DoxX family protein [Bryobacteraceae bacterium]